MDLGLQNNVVGIVCCNFLHCDIFVVCGGYQVQVLYVMFLWFVDCYHCVSCVYGRDCFICGRKLAGVKLGLSDLLIINDDVFTRYPVSCKVDFCGCELVFSPDQLVDKLHCPVLVWRG